MADHVYLYLQAAADEQAAVQLQAAAKEKALPTRQGPLWQKAWQRAGVAARRHGVELAAANWAALQAAADEKARALQAATEEKEAALQAAAREMAAALQAAAEERAAALFYLGW